MKLLTVENAKTSKGVSLGYLTGILYLAPHRIAGYESVCPHSTPGCRAACLYSAGRGRFASIQEARILKTVQFFEARDAFIDQLDADIKALKRAAARRGLKPAVRLNGTSDIDWQGIAPRLFVEHPDVQFYDYTKDWNRTSLFANYDLTYSYDEQRASVHPIGRTAIVVSSQQTEESIGVDGDAHDLRFLDAPKAVVYLRPKGRALKDKTGFVI
jgi:hypothetical protein